MKKRNLIICLVFAGLATLSSCTKEQLDYLSGEDNEEQSDNGGSSNTTDINRYAETAITLTTSGGASYTYINSSDKDHYKSTIDIGQKESHVDTYLRRADVSTGYTMLDFRTASISFINGINAGQTITIANGNGISFRGLSLNYVSGSITVTNVRTESDNMRYAKLQFNNLKATDGVTTYTFSGCAKYMVSEIE